MCNAVHTSAPSLQKRVPTDFHLRLQASDHEFSATVVRRQIGVIQAGGEGGLPCPPKLNAGLYLLDPAVLTEVNFPTRFSLEADFFETHTEKLVLAGQPLVGYFIDIGIPEDYAWASENFKSHLS